jgi:glutathione-regulated potassium-efflux system ancillary protein KefG
MSETKILLNLFHPDIESSRINQALFEGVKEVPNLSYRDLYLEYDGKYVDTNTEKIFLSEYDLFIFQYPMYWFNAPTLFTEWMERALEKGFAWPPGIGNELKGKKWLTVVTTAACADDYTDTQGSASIQTLLKPFEMTATYCQMEWLPPFIIHDARDPKEGGLTEEQLKTEVTSYLNLIESL